jgi:hypothetical protein
MAMRPDLESMDTAGITDQIKDAVKLLEEAFITGREGFFCLKSSKNLTVTIDSWMGKTKRFIHSNFDAINLSW